MAVFRVRGPHLGWVWRGASGGVIHGQEWEGLEGWEEGQRE